MTSSPASDNSSLQSQRGLPQLVTDRRTVGWLHLLTWSSTGLASCSFRSCPRALAHLDLTSALTCSARTIRISPSERTSCNSHSHSRLTRHRYATLREGYTVDHRKQYTTTSSSQAQTVLWRCSQANTWLFVSLWTTARHALSRASSCGVFNQIPLLCSSVIRLDL